MARGLRKLGLRYVLALAERPLRTKAWTSAFTNAIEQFLLQVTQA